MYRALPKAVFQGDLNDSNILLDDFGHFAGLIDLNLSGTETILNYAFCESFACLNDGEDVAALMEPASLARRDAETARRLGWIGREYAFSDAERAAFADLWHMSAPFRWPYHAYFMSLLGNPEQYPDGAQHASTVLDWMEYEFTRGDTARFLP